MTEAPAAAIAVPLRVRFKAAWIALTEVTSTLRISRFGPAPIMAATPDRLKKSLSQPSPRKYVAFAHILLTSPCCWAAK